MQTFALLVALIAWIAPASARNLALVIGNDAYQNVPALSTAASDASAVGDQLERLGFLVRRALNVDHGGMSRALSAFNDQLAPGDQALFFYAGHGLEIFGANYLLPTDVPQARTNQQGLVRDASFPVEQIIDGIRARGVHAAILVLDACRDNPFATPGTRSAAASGGLARVDAGAGVFVLMSAGAKQEALDRLSTTDPDRNSVFTRTFLQELARPGLTMVQIAKATQVGVKDLAASVGYEQTPAYYDQVIGDVVLSPGSGTGAASAGEDRAGAAGVRPRPPQDIAANARAPQVASLPPPTLPVGPPPGLPSSSPSQPRLGGRAPLASFMRSNVGWTATISLPEPALEMSYRIGDKGEFRSTGLSQILDQRTGEPMPNLSVQLAANQPASTLQIRYTTPDGGSVGPFLIPFDPDVALFREQKRILEMMSGKWAEFGHADGAARDLPVYFTMLISYRCAISDVRYGLDDGQPLARYDLPSCDPRNPFSVPNGARVWLTVPARTRSITLQITWRDGTQSEASTIARE